MKDPDLEQVVFESFISLVKRYGTNSKTVWQCIQNDLELSCAIQDAVEYNDFNNIATMVESGSNLLFKSDEARAVVAKILRGEIKGKRGISGREQKRKAKRDRFILMRIPYWIGYGCSPVWTPTDPGICGIVSRELFEQGLKPMEPEAIYRHVWKNRKTSKRIHPNLQTPEELSHRAGEIQAKIDIKPRDE